MKIERKDDGKKGEFTAINEGEKAGLMTYVWTGEDKFIIDHTEVESEFSGQGVGKKLVMAAVEFARENKLKIIPLCPYAKSVFDKSQELHDVLA
ncbi:MAG: GNAT family N-acetyltransferase [Weeksellaceae bacterium]